MKAIICQEPEKLVVEEIMRIISLVKNRKLLCNVCKKYNRGIIKICAMDPLRG